MTDYREILRLHSQGISQRSIAVSNGCSRTRNVQKAHDTTQKIAAANPGRVDAGSAQRVRSQGSAGNCRSAAQASLNDIRFTILTKRLAQSHWQRRHSGRRNPRSNRP